MQCKTNTMLNTKQPFAHSDFVYVCSVFDFIEAKYRNAPFRQLIEPASNGCAFVSIDLFKFMNENQNLLGQCKQQSKVYRNIEYKQKSSAFQFFCL